MPARVYHSRMLVTLWRWLTGKKGIEELCPMRGSIFGMRDAYSGVSAVATRVSSDAMEHRRR